MRTAAIGSQPALGLLAATLATTLWDLLDDPERMGGYLSRAGRAGDGHACRTGGPELAYPDIK